jgi:hypothetical protein
MKPTKGNSTATASSDAEVDWDAVYDEIIAAGYDDSAEDEDFEE